MFSYPQAPRAWGFTRGMARVIGCSLTDAVVDGWLNRNELAALVKVCETCGQTRQCTTWLAKTVEASALPAFCPNAAALTALKP